MSNNLTYSNIMLSGTEDIARNDERMFQDTHIWSLGFKFY